MAVLPGKLLAVLGTPVALKAAASSKSALRHKKADDSRAKSKAKQDLAVQEAMAMFS